MTTESKNTPTLRLPKLGVNTILGRFILIAGILVICTLTVAWFSHQKVKATSIANTQSLKDRLKVARDVRALTNALWQDETNFQLYMLAPSKPQNAAVVASLDKTIAHARTLSGDEWPGEAPTTGQDIIELIANIQALKKLLLYTMQMRVHPQRLFTAMPMMVYTLNPLNSQFVSTATLAIDEADQSPDDPQQQAIGKLFRDIRYLWSERISTFRILASSRVGMFTESPDANIKATAYEISAFDQAIGTKLNTLLKLNAKNELGFEQSIAIGQLVTMRKQWNATYEKVKSIMLDGQKWRRDTPLLRNKIHPLFSHIWEKLQTVKKEIDRRSITDIHTITSVADQVTYYAWILTGIVIMIAILATLVFDFQIRRPLARVSRALKDEAAGNNTAELPQTSLVETRDLVAAFTNMREQVHNRQEHLQAVLTYAVEAIITTNNDGIIESLNPAAKTLFRCANEVLGDPISKWIPAVENYLDEGSDNEIELTAITKDGTRIPTGVTISTMQVSQRKLHLIILSDISERLAMLDGIMAREQRLRSILDNTAEAIVTFDDTYQIETWNSAAENLFGRKEQDVIGHHFFEYISLENTEPDDKRDDCTRLQTLVGVETEVTGHHINGGLFPVSLKMSKMLIDNKNKFTALIANISERKAMMENLRQLAEHDSLTGLYNRAYFHGHLEYVAENLRNGKSSASALFYMDLDNFKYVNDILGHAAGDELLLEVSHILNDRTRRSDLVARLGGDEFVILINDAKHDAIQAIAESFRRTLSDYTFHYDGRAIDIGCSIGVAIINEDHKTPGEILSQADLACHLAKREGRNRVHIYTDHDHGNVRTMSIDMGWSRRIKNAIENDHFLLALQPIVESASGKVEEFEVLIRMQDEDGAIVMPNGFLPTAERFGLSSNIDAWVIQHSLEYLATLRQNIPDIRFAINLSGQSITSQTILQLIPEVLSQTKLDADALTFEVTETAAIADMNKAVRLLKQLRELGCQTALDDFGSGMSSFAYLRELPVDIVKIDGRFVKNVMRSSVDLAMVRAMNDIAHALGKRTVAEFIENEQSHQLIAQLGIDYCQGFYFSEPTIVDIQKAKLTPSMEMRFPSHSKRQLSI